MTDRNDPMLEAFREGLNSTPGKDLQKTAEANAQKMVEIFEEELQAARSHHDERYFIPTCLLCQRRPRAEWVGRDPDGPGYLAWHQEGRDYQSVPFAAKQDAVTYLVEKLSRAEAVG